MALQIVFFLAFALLLYIACDDFLNLKVRNNSVWALLTIYAAFAVATGLTFVMTDLAAGAILFSIGVVFWCFGLMGAGDAKLYLPVGLFAGLEGLAPFAMFLIVFSLLLLLIVRIGTPLFRGRFLFGRRLAYFRSSGKLPYSVPINASLALVLAFRIATMG